MPKRKSAPTYTKEERADRWATCAKYIRRTRTLPEAMSAAHADGVSFDTSVWISAFGKVLERGERPGDLIQ